MEWADEPATWRQLKSLKQLGHHLEHRLTKVEAAQLIRSLGGNPEDCEPAGRAALHEVPQPGAFQLRLRAEAARKAIAEAGKAKPQKMQQELTLAVAARQDFWMDTCRVTGTGPVNMTQTHHLYQKFGCRFEPPSRKDVQYILDALDSAMPFWDRDHPELFFQTLELNFAGLLRRSPGMKG
jgi:hypothetical protein